MISKREFGSFVLGALVGGIGIRYTTHIVYLGIIITLIAAYCLKA